MKEGGHFQLAVQSVQCLHCAHVQVNVKVNPANALAPAWRLRLDELRQGIRNETLVEAPTRVRDRKMASHVEGALWHPRPRLWQTGERVKAVDDACLHGG